MKKIIPAFYIVLIVILQSSCAKDLDKKRVETYLIEKYELKARKLYMKYHQRTCAGNGKLVSVENLGLVVSVDNPFLGASLDGFIRCPKCGDGALEIKCSWKHRLSLGSYFSSSI